MYAVFAENGRYAPERRALSISCSIRKCARSGPFGGEHAVERVEPFPRFLRIVVGSRRPSPVPPRCNAMPGADARAFRSSDCMRGDRCDASLRCVPRLHAAPASRSYHQTEIDFQYCRVVRERRTGVAAVSVHLLSRRQQVQPAQPERRSTGDEAGAVAAGQRREQREQRRADDDAAEGDEPGRAGDRAACARRARGARPRPAARRSSRSPSRRTARRSPSDQRRRPVRRRTSPSPRRTGRRATPSRPSRRRGATQRSATAPQTIRPAMPPSVGDGEREPGGDERHSRATRSGRRRGSSSGRPASPRRRSPTSDELGQRARAEHDPQRREHAGQRKRSRRLPVGVERARARAAPRPRPATPERGDQRRTPVASPAPARAPGSTAPASAAPAGTPVCLIENVSAIRDGGAVRASTCDDAGVIGP